MTPTPLGTNTESAAPPLGSTETPARARSPDTSQSIGFFLDLGGKDTYDVTGTPAKNDTSWTQSALITKSKPADHDAFDPAPDHGYGFDGTAMWPAW